MKDTRKERGRRIPLINRKTVANVIPTVIVGCCNPVANPSSKKKHLRLNEPEVSSIQRYNKDRHEALP